MNPNIPTNETPQAEKPSRMSRFANKLRDPNTYNRAINVAKRVGHEALLATDIITKDKNTGGVRYNHEGFRNALDDPQAALDKARAGAMSGLRKGVAHEAVQFARDQVAAAFNGAPATTEGFQPQGMPDAAPQQGPAEQTPADTNAAAMPGAQAPVH